MTKLIAAIGAAVNLNVIHSRPPSQCPWMQRISGLTDYCRRITRMAFHPYAVGRLVGARSYARVKAYRE
jgi:hypothetical protein